jgi:AraC-like DNA-binding protein
MKLHDTKDHILLGALLLLGLALAVLECVLCPYLLGVTAAFYLCGAAFFYRQSRPRDPEEPLDNTIGWRNSDRQLLGFIERLLKGCDMQRVSGVQLPTQSPFFVVFGVDMVDAASEETPDAAANAEMEVCNQLAMAFSQHYFWPMNIDGRLICVVNLRSEPDHPLQTDAIDTVVIPAMKAAAAALIQEGIPIRIATSGLSVGTESLSIAYQNTIDIFDQLVLTRPDNQLHIVLANPKVSSSCVDHVTRAQTEKLFNNYIIARELENAKLALLKLTEYEVQEQEFSLVLKRMTSNRLEWSLDVLTLPPEKSQQLREKIDEIANATYLDELTALIEAWFQLLEATISAPEKDTLVPKVMTYITENCLNPDLNVAMLSEHFHISASYLSNVFHNQAGVRLIDFIHQQRLKKVKQLLRETELPIAQIAEVTGYYSAMSMSRAFKRYEGVTPSAFRNS